MATRALLTIDTELVWRHHAAGLCWHENFARSYEAAGVGVPYQLRLLAEHGLKACFFVDPMSALVHGLDPVKRMVEPILAAGQEVQLHLHPFWARLAAGDAHANARELNDFPPTEQRAMIEQARDLLVAAGAPAPIAFRAGSYAAAAATLEELARLGIRYDSSHNGCHHPRPSAIPLPPSQVSPVAVSGVIEVPVGQIDEGRGRMRHLQLCALSVSEMRAALAHACRERQPAVTIVSHSFELATRSGLAVNEVVRRRFVRLCGYLAAQRETMPTAWFADLEGIETHEATSPAPGLWRRRLVRMAEQAWGDLRHERPARAAQRRAHVA